MLKTSFILAAAFCTLSVPADAAPSPASICAPVKAQQQTFSSARVSNRSMPARSA